ncbi:MAG TPA: HD-GYP domain-containing protein [Candidatus Sulfotelmatobacter sp.]|nr:HD-GYP domain-containing protein [Candidatus Sulfotelmatobacter sp.]
MALVQDQTGLVSTAISGEIRRCELRMKELESEVRELRSALVCSFNQLLDLRDLNTGVHSTRLAEWGLRVARDLGVVESSMYDLEMGALLHDIGKIGVPDQILNKPGRLTPEEFEFVKRHPEFGWTVIRKLPGLEQTSLYVLHHHENFDGTGYPARLKGSEIPIGSRIISVIDAFDAMVSSRPYRKGLPLAEALRRLNEASGTQFDPSVIHSFVPIAESEMPSVLEAVGVTESAAF